MKKPVNTVDKRQHDIAVDTIKNPNKALMGGLSVDDAKKTLKRKFAYTDAEIAKLEESIKATNKAILSNKEKQLVKEYAKKLISKRKLNESSNDDLLGKLQKIFPSIKFRKEYDFVIANDKNLFDKYAYSQFGKKPKSHDDLRKVLKEPGLIIDPAVEDSHTILFTVE